MICKNDKPAQILHNLEVAINAFTIACGCGPTTRTCGIRAIRVGHPSFHPKDQARDHRGKDKPEEWFEGVVYIIKAFQCIDHHLQYTIHGEGDNLHLHFEYDTGDPI